MYTGQEYAKHLIQKPNTFYYGSPCNKLYRRDLLRKHSLHFRKELFAEDQLFNTEYLRFVHTAVSIPDIGYYYLQNGQSVSHSRVTTADILSLRRRVMLLYRDIYTELGIYGNAGGHPAFALWRKRVHSSASGHPTDALLQAVTL